MSDTCVQGDVPRRISESTGAFRSAVPVGVGVAVTHPADTAIRVEHH
jgi:hypothetical protein